MNLDKNKIEIILARKIMTRSELARQCGIAKQNISIILNHGACSTCTAGKIARGLGVDVSEIILSE